MIKVKADFHVHTSLDPKDSIDYSPKEIISIMAKYGFRVIALSHHNKRIFTVELRDFAKDLGVLLVPSIEATIDGRDFLVIGAKRDVLTLDDLKKEREEGAVVVYAHPFYTSCGFKKPVLDYLDYVDYLEINSFFSLKQNYLNDFARKLALDKGKGIIGSGDIHIKDLVGYTYSEIEMKDLSVESLFEALRLGRVKVREKSLPFYLYLKVGFNHFFSFFRKKKKTLNT